MSSANIEIDRDRFLFCILNKRPHFAVRAGGVDMPFGLWIFLIIATACGTGHAIFRQTKVH
jgi:hypothetical protein